MARFLGVEIPDNKRAVISLTYVKGIGLYWSKRLLSECKIDESKRVSDFTDEDFANLRQKIQQHALPVEGELRRMVYQNIRRLQDIKSYRGIRHSRGLPVRGQRTNSNARTRKGKKKTVAGARLKGKA